MNKIQLSIILFFMNLMGFGQSLQVNYDIDTNVFDVSEALHLWLDFLKTQDDLKGSTFWNSREVEKYGETSYFLIEKELQFGMDNYLQLLSYADLKVLSIVKLNDYFKITSAMEFKPKEDQSQVNYIFHVYAGKENGQLKLFNPLEINTSLYFNTTKMGFITYHYPKSHKFNRALAEKQNSYLLELSEGFEIEFDTIDYYFANTRSEILEIRGFDFLIGNSGDEIPTGKADPKNRIVYTSGTGEYYPHELIHVLLNPNFPNCHLWINEGVATYFGMSRGKDLDWHLNKLNHHLQAHPEIDLNSMLKLNSLDQNTGYKYALGGLLIKMAYEKGSYKLVTKMMNAGKSEANFYGAIETFLGIPRQQLNHTLREELNDQY